MNAPFFVTGDIFCIEPASDAVAIFRNQQQVKVTSTHNLHKQRSEQPEPHQQCQENRPRTDLTLAGLVRCHHYQKGKGEEQNSPAQDRHHHRVVIIDLSSTAAATIITLTIILPIDTMRRRRVPYHHLTQ